MRPIDGDALIRKIIKDIKAYPYCEQILLDILDAPTLDLIPYEWIKQWEKDEDLGTVGTTVVNRLVYSWKNKDWGMWRKENETN